MVYKVLSEGEGGNSSAGGSGTIGAAGTIDVAGANIPFSLAK